MFRYMFGWIFRKLSVLIVAIPVVLIGQAAFGEWGMIALYLAVVFVQQLMIAVLDARKRQRAS